MATIPQNKRPALSLSEPMMRVTIASYSGEFVVPWDVGVQLLTLLKDATPIESYYENNQSGWRRREVSNISATAMMPEEVAQVMMSDES